MEVCFLTILLSTRWRFKLQCFNNSFSFAGMGSIASSGRSGSPLGFSERLSVASGSIQSIGSAGGDVTALSPQQLGVMGKCNNSLIFIKKYLVMEGLIKILERHLWLSSGTLWFAHSLSYKIIYTFISRWRHTYSKQFQSLSL